VAGTDGLAWFKTHGSDEHHVVRLHKAVANHVEVIALAADGRCDVDALHDRVAQAGCLVVHAPCDLDAPGGGYGFRFFSPDGLPFEISADVKRRDKRGLDRWEGLPVQISHVVLHSPDHHAAARFFTEVLGFRVSDWLGDFMVFLRCNSAHHRLAILPGPPCLNHVAYDMLSVDDMMCGRAGCASAAPNCAGARAAQGGQQRLQLLHHAQRLRRRIHRRSRGGRLRDAPAHRARSRPAGDGPVGIGVGGPQTMPHPAPDPRLFQRPRCRRRCNYPPEPNDTWAAMQLPSPNPTTPDAT
jgi:catechol 2,3-dioxygenase-like lactoylglutathione lyase family enzyme